MADITLSDVSMRLKRGSIDNLPASAPEGELLLVTLANGNKALYVGTGDGVAPIAAAGDSSIINRIYGCILEAPNGIASLSGTTLTIPAGMKMSCPNSFNADKTLAYNEVNLTSTVTVNTSTWGQNEYYIFLSAGTTVYKCLKHDFFAQSNKPSGLEGSTGVWYDTDENVYKYTSNGGTSWSNLANTCPVAKIELIDGAYQFIGYTPYRVVTRYELEAELAKKQDLLTWDTVPTQNSLNPVTSGGIFNATASKADAEFNGAERYAFISGNVAATDGKEQVLAYSGSVISFNVGGSYPGLTMCNCKGKIKTFSSLSTLNVSSLSNGVYNLFISMDGTKEYYINTIYRQTYAPTSPATNDVWFKTLEPLEVYKWNGSTWVDYSNYVPLGTFTVASGAVTYVRTFYFNFNGINRRLVETYASGNDWYNVFLQYDATSKDIKPWVEQGGLYYNAGITTITVNLSKRCNYSSVNVINTGFNAGWLNENFEPSWSVCARGSVTQGYTTTEYSSQIVFCGTDPHAYSITGYAAF